VLVLLFYGSTVALSIWNPLCQM